MCKSENNSSAHISVFEQMHDHDRITIIVKTWIRDFEPELKSQSNIWKGIISPRAKQNSSPTNKSETNDDSCLR